jgi:hypothetical protein
MKALQVQQQVGATLLWWHAVLPAAAGDGPHEPSMNHHNCHKSIGTCLTDLKK